MELKEALESALEFEKRGQKLYSEAAEKTENPIVEKTFKYLAEQEASSDSDAGTLRRILRESAIKPQVVAGTATLDDIMGAIDQDTTIPQNGVRQSRLKSSAKRLLDSHTYERSASYWPRIKDGFRRAVTAQRVAILSIIFLSGVMILYVLLQDQISQFADHGIARGFTHYLAFYCEALPQVDLYLFSSRLDFGRSRAGKVKAGGDQRVRSRG